MIFVQIDPKLTINDIAEAWGLIPGFLDPDDPRTAIEQFDAKYIGGWRPQEGFKRKSDKLVYPGDPPMKPISVTIFGGDLIYLYPYAYVCVVKPDGSFEVCRMD